ncbi:MAG TPA: aldo/keto reductase [Chitinophagaceae bacterium]|nr:aldo/keto reductase [Chitinophagaceae bacterium]
MQYRKFGNTDLLVSEIGFGAWAIGGNAMIGSVAIGWGDADDNESKKAIHRSLDLGINFFDTADIYGLGHSEKLLGGLLGKRKDVIIASKVGNVARNEKFTTDYSKQHIMAACEASLKRLKRDVIDHYQLHSARVLQLEQQECIEAMQLLQQQGKIRYWGLSLNTFDPAPEAEFLMNKNRGNGFQLVLNIINQKALPLLKNAQAKGYGVIARMPLQFGLLTGKFDKGFSFSENDHRKNRLTKEVIDTCDTALTPVWKLCKKYNCTKTQLALSYILSYPEVSTVIPGIRTAAQAESNTSGMIKLDQADIDFIEELGATDLIPVMKLIQQQG